MTFLNPVDWVSFGNIGRHANCKVDLLGLNRLIWSDLEKLYLCKKKIEEAMFVPSFGNFLQSHLH